MSELLSILDAVDSVGIAILIWRSWVADNERSMLMKHQQQTQEWLEGLLHELLSRKKNE